MSEQSCRNCDGRKCMGCVFREYDHECRDDCPDCCAEANLARNTEWWTAALAEARTIAHTAYHDHNENCGCRTVEHLTEWIADAVVNSVLVDPTVEREAA